MVSLKEEAILDIYIQIKTKFKYNFLDAAMYFKFLNQIQTRAYFFVLSNSTKWLYSSMNHIVECSCLGKR